MQIDIILCHPQHPGNIGFTARAMKTMGFNKLVIVTRRPIDMEAAAVTATDAQDVLSACSIKTDLKDILDDYHFLVAFTARKRYFRNHSMLPELGETLRSVPERVKTGLLFGRESSGLTNSEISVCQHIVTIPTASKFHSLNLSHAVQVACYELARSGIVRTGPVNKKIKLATAHEREAVFRKLEYVSKEIGLTLQEGQKIGTIFRTLFEERELGKREAGALHRFLDQIIHGPRA